MIPDTLLDQTHAAMLDAPEDEALRLQFYDRLAHSELFVLLQSDTDDGDTITPELFDLGDAQYLLAFDREERLAQFVGKEAPYAALSGRVIAHMLADQSIGIGLNLEVAPSSILLPAEAVHWLNATLENAPREVEARPVELFAPKGLPDQMISALDARLASAMGLAQSAFLVGVAYDSGARGHMLGFVAALPHAHGALTRLAGEALTFSGIEAGAIDVAYFDATDPIIDRMERVGLRFDLPQPQEAGRTARPAPGSDPDKPPKLK